MSDEAAGGMVIGVASTSDPIPVAPRKRGRPAKAKVPRAPRPPRDPSILVVGHWADVPDAIDGSRQFVPAIAQPGEGLTEVADLVAWAQEALQPGSYDVIRMVPGALLIAEQKKVTATFG